MASQLVPSFIPIIRPLFPEDAEIKHAITTIGESLIIQWPLMDDPERPNKRSTIINLCFSREVIGDWSESHRAEAEIRLKAFIQKHLAAFNPCHNASCFKSPPIEQWPVVWSF